MRRAIYGLRPFSFSNAFAFTLPFGDAERDGGPHGDTLRFAVAGRVSISLGVAVTFGADLSDSDAGDGRRMRLNESVGAPLLFKRQRGRVEGPQAMPFIAATGVSWWEAFYEDGRTVGEWDSILDDRSKIKVPSRKTAGSSRWEEINRKGLRGLRLIGPNGQVADLRSSRDGAFFQLKLGIARLGAGVDPFRAIGAHRKAHLIGVIVDPPVGVRAQRGACVCFAFEHLPDGRGRMVGPFSDAIGIETEEVLVDGQKVRRPDGLKYQGIGPLSLENLGLTV